MSLEPSRSERADVKREVIVGCREADLSAPARDVLSRIPWDGRALEPSRTSAAQFLGALVRG